jgi:hypothetical protein
MADNNIVGKLLADLGEKAKDIERIYGILKSLKEYDDTIEIPDIATLIGSGCSEITSNSSGISIRPDEFYGLSNTDASEKYLRKIGHAAPLEEIYNALMKGGINFSSNGRNNLNIMLTRATRKFAKIVSDSVIHFGLLEWNPKKSRAKTIIDQFETLEDIAVEIEEKEINKSVEENEDSNKKEKSE